VCKKAEQYFVNLMLQLAVLYSSGRCKGDLIETDEPRGLQHCAGYSPWFLIVRKFKCCKIMPWILENEGVPWKVLENCCLVWKMLLHNCMAHKCCCEFLKHWHSVDYLLTSRRSSSHCCLVNILRYLERSLKSPLRRSFIHSFIRGGGWPLAVFRRAFQPTASAEA